MSGWSLDLHGISASESKAIIHHSPIKDCDKHDRFMPLFDDAHFVRSSTNSFCTNDNLLNSVGYINQEFELLGLPSLKFDNGQRTFDLLFVINRVYDLLTLYHKTFAVKEDLENRNHSLACETEHHHATSLRLKRLQDQSNREIDQEQEKLRQINIKYKQASNKLKTEKEEVKRLTAVIQSRDIQQRHELKKMEREIHKLKERLHQLLADKVPDRKVGMDMMSIVGRTEGRRATWKTGPQKQEEEMYQLLINNYEERHQEVMQENSELRDCLLSLQRELSALLKRTGDMSVMSGLDLRNIDDVPLSPEDEDVEEDSSPPSRLSISDLNAGYFQMPYDMVRQEIEKTFKETCDQISESMKKSLVRSHPSITMSKLSGGSPTSCKETKDKRQALLQSSEVDRLNHQIKKYKTIMQQQAEIIQQSIIQQPQSDEASFLHESRLLKEKENLSEQKKLFFEEKSNFEKDRQAYTEAAIRLGKERQSLQDERANFLKQHFLSLSPFKESNNKKTRDGQTNRLLPATPIFLPAKSGTGKPTAFNTPSVGSQHMALGLSPSQSRIKESSPPVALKKLFRSSSLDGRNPDHKSTPGSNHQSASANLESIKASLLKISFQQAKSTGYQNSVSDNNK